MEIIIVVVVVFVVWLTYEIIRAPLMPDDYNTEEEIEDSKDP
tara:strand:+ start:772 stop:897 length:126 start_codon:yes stop_codon:yes gene_type:complete